MSETLLGYLLILGRLCLSTKWGVSSLGMTDSKMEQVQQARIFCGQATRCSYSPHCLIDGCKTMKEVVCTGCEDKKIKFWWCRLAFHLVHLFAWFGWTNLPNGSPFTSLSLDQYPIEEMWYHECLCLQLHYYFRGWNNADEINAPEFRRKTGCKSWSAE